MKVKLKYDHVTPPGKKITVGGCEFRLERNAANTYTETSGHPLSKSYVDLFWGGVDGSQAIGLWFEAQLYRR
jgi:hypothetical protein